MSDGKCSVTSETCTDRITGSDVNSAGDGCECPDGKVDNGKGACKEQCECDVNSGEVTCYKDDDDGACVPNCDGYLTGSSYSTESSMCVCPEGKTDMGDGACVAS